MKTSIVERFNRTLKNDMWKQFTHNGNHKWLDFLPSVGIQRESIEYIDVAHRCDFHEFQQTLKHGVQ